MSTRAFAFDDDARQRLAENRLYRFHGGLRLRHNKKISCELPVAPVPLPERLFVPLLQQAGPEARPTVEPGQHVLKGEAIGCFRHLGAGCLHAPTSGTVEAIIDHPASQASGQDGRCIVIRPDGRDAWRPREPIADWGHAAPSALRRRIADSGIVGLGGAVFPTGYKVDQASARGIHTVILNGSECEPWISCDEMLMREQPDAIVLGARILQRAVGAERTLIAIEDQMGAVHQALQDAVDRSGADDIRVIKVTTIYPEGGEKQLIQVLTGLEVPSGGRPTDLGLLCQNVATAVAAARAVTEDKPLIERIVTVTGPGVRRPRNVLARIGTPLADLVALAGGYTEQAARLVLGGPMMGYPLATDANPVIKAANCLLVLGAADLHSAQVELPCIRCGECARVCPSVLLPQELNRAIRAGLWEAAEDLGLRDCIECGCCDVVCPSHIPLVEWFRFGKSELRERFIERSRAERARARFEARQERLERIKRERKQRLAEKKRALRDGQDRKAEVAAAIARARKKQERKP
ncbi:MAG: electron transport complex subunit RsxC [Xanthomonadales bacterium]